MIGHQAIAQDSHRPFFERFHDDSFEGKVIIVTEKQLLLAHATIDDMINHPSRRYSCCPGHGSNVQNNDARVNNWTCPRFCARRKPSCSSLAASSSTYASKTAS